MYTFKEDIASLVVVLIKMLIRLIKKKLDMGELTSGSFWILVTYIFHFNYKTLQESSFLG